MQHHTRLYLYALRSAAVLIFIFALLVVALPQSLASDPRWNAWATFLVACAAGVGLFALASLVSNQSKAPADVNSAFNRIEQQLTQLHIKMNDLALMSDRASRAQNSATMIPAKDNSPQFEKLSEAIAELRELTLMTEQQRLARGQAYQNQRKTDRVKEIFAFVGAHDWPKAERFLSIMESEFPGDSEVGRARMYLDHSRRLFEEETIVRSVVEVEELVADSNWDEARRKAQELVQGFPTNGDAQVLLQRVEHEWQFHRETDVRNKIEQIRSAVDRKTWQEALDLAEQLAATFPEHQLVEAVRKQIPTLRANLEIEERQSLEVRLQELIRSGNIEQAIELAEDVIRRYPHSPQAESLEKLLPRIREMATEGVNEFAGFGGEATNPFNNSAAIPRQPDFDRIFEEKPENMNT